MTGGGGGGVWDGGRVWDGGGVYEDLRNKEQRSGDGGGVGVGVRVGVGGGGKVKLSKLPFSTIVVCSKECCNTRFFFRYTIIIIKK